MEKIEIQFTKIEITSEGKKGMPNFNLLGCIGVGERDILESTTKIMKRLVGVWGDMNIKFYAFIPDEGGEKGITFTAESKCSRCGRDY